MRVPQVWAKTDLHTLSCRPFYMLFVIKRQKRNTLTSVHIFLPGKSLDCFITAIPYCSILHRKSETYIFQSVLHPMSLIVWSKIAFCFVEWRRQMSLSHRTLKLSARCRTKMWSQLPGAQGEVLYFQNFCLSGIDIVWISLHMCEMG